MLPRRARILALTPDGTNGKRAMQSAWRVSYLLLRVEPCGLSIDGDPAQGAILMSFLTCVTPLVAWAIFTALSASPCDFAVPLSWTIPLSSVSTLMASALTAGSFMNSALIFAVITESLSNVFGESGGFAAVCGGLVWANFPSPAARASEGSARAPMTNAVVASFLLICTSQLIDEHP